MSNFEFKNYALDISKNVLSKGQVVDKDVITQSIETILMTDRYERVMEPSFGSMLSGLVFERLDRTQASTLLDDIINLIRTFETRVSILSNACRLKVNVENHYIEIKIVYVIIGGSVEEFNKRIVF
jgi:phage baseplate assembly protein W